MTERPILFSAPMVRAILDGRKGQTRRLLKFEHADDVDRWHDHGDGVWEMGVNGEGGACAGMGTLRCPFGAVGDRLWVRETHALRDDVDGTTDPSKARHYAIYRADRDGDDLGMEWHNYGRWRPSIHMPRWASRLTLEITGVRVERLQAITEADAQAEGATVGEMQDAIINGEPGRVVHFNARDAFAHLWCGINGADSWRANPFVWALTFKRVEARRG